MFAENVLRFWGVYKLLVGILALTESLIGILRSADGPALNPWGPVTVAAAVLLAIDGLAELFPQMHGWLLVALAAILPLVISISSGEWPLKVWMFAAATAFVEWMFQQLEGATGPREIGALVCAATLALSLANTTLMLFHVYWNAPEFWPLGQIFRFMLPIALPWTLVLILLVHATRDLTMRGDADIEPQMRAGVRSGSAT